MMLKNWTENEEMVARAREMWVSGTSATVIAAALGHGITRNAVMGKMHRMGYRRPNFKPRVVKVRPSAPATVTPGPIRRSKFQPPPPMLASEATALPPEPPIDGVTIMELTPTTCRWPIGDDRYCGGHAPWKKSYCAKHHSVSVGRET